MNYLLTILLGLGLAFFVLLRWAFDDLELSCRSDGCHNRAYDGGYCVGCWGYHYE